MRQELANAQGTIKTAKEILKRELELKIIADDVLNVFQLLIKQSERITNKETERVTKKEEFESAIKEKEELKNKNAVLKKKVRKLERINLQLKAVVQEFDKMLNKVKTLSEQNNSMKNQIMVIRKSWKQFCEREDIVWHINNPHLGAKHTCPVCKLWSEINRINEAITSL